MFRHTDFKLFSFAAGTAVFTPSPLPPAGGVNNCIMIENTIIMNEMEIRRKAENLVSSIRDLKVVSAFQVLLSNANNIQQILLLIELVELHQSSSKNKEQEIIKKVICLGQERSNMSERLALVFIVNDVVRLFFKSRKVSLKTTVEKQEILKTRRDTAFKRF